MDKNNVDDELYKNFKDMYEGVTKGDMDKVMRQYDKLPVPLPKNLTVFGDTLLHIAIYMGQEDIARKILKRYVDGHHCDLIRKANNVGDTVLHEVAATNMVSLAKDLLDNVPELLSSRNNLGEMPLFKAAYNGQLDMFDVLSLAVNLRDKHNLHRHLIRDEDRKDKKDKKDETNILHMTILAEFFDLAFIIAKKYPGLVDEKDAAGKIGLQLLSDNPSAFLSSRNYGLLKKLIFKYCVPTSVQQGQWDESDDREDFYELDSLDHHKDPENNMPPIYTRCMSIVASVLTRINVSIWTYLRGCPAMERIYKDYRKHESAFRLAKLLIKKDTTWETNVYKKEDKGKISLFPRRREEDHDVEKDKATSTGKNKIIIDVEKDKARSLSLTRQNLPTPPTSLLRATTNGIVEIVKEILRVYPQAVEHVSDAGQNILHVAIKHRQLEIFNYIKKMKLPMSRLVRRIDDNGYTILHHVGVMKFYTGGTIPGPALQLQEELHWFERVEDIVPPHYKKHLSDKKKKPDEEDETSSKEKNEYGGGETAKELFFKTHNPLREKAVEWLKNTSKSCSTVAVLIATVAFAAAYTIPGGSDSKTGAPILLHDPFFLVFTVMDVLSLATSLTSVVMFLSILTSPFELQDFKDSLPQKLTLGFTFLFISVAMTMLAFAATIVLTIHLKKRWITILVYCLAFLPVTLFALLQYPLYLFFMDTINNAWNMIKHSLSLLFPWFSNEAVSAYKQD